jgi:hypothetical protein
MVVSPVPRRGLPRVVGDFPGSGTGDLACEPGERLDVDEETVRFESDVRPRPRFGYWVARQRFLLRGQVSMLLLGVVLGCLFFLLLRASLGVSVAAPAPGAPAQTSTEASPPHTTEHFRSAELALLPQLLAAVAEPRLGRAEARAERAKTSRKHRPATPASCDPPYRYDAAGIKRIKRACL